VFTLTDKDSGVTRYSDLLLLIFILLFDKWLAWTVLRRRSRKEPYHFHCRSLIIYTVLICLILPIYKPRDRRSRNHIIFLPGAGHTTKCNGSATLIGHTPNKSCAAKSGTKFSVSDYSELGFLSFSTLNE
jgi:hypothetical protein